LLDLLENENYTLGPLSSMYELFWPLKDDEKAKGKLQKLYFLLELNGQGSRFEKQLFHRKRLIGDGDAATEEEWVNVIVHALTEEYAFSKDTFPESAAFYYLSRKPSLLERQTSTNTSPKANEKTSHQEEDSSQEESRNSDAKFHRRPRDSQSSPKCSTK
jgi:hypothetical protein